MHPSAGGLDALRGRAAPGTPLGTPLLVGPRASPLWLLGAAAAAAPSTPAPLPYSHSWLLGKCNLSQATFNYCDAVF